MERSSRRRWLVSLMVLVSFYGCKESTSPAAPPAKLAFTVQPTTVIAGATIAPSVAVTVQDASGNAVPSAGISVALSLESNPGSGTLSGTTTVAAASGVATFANLSIDKSGTAYTLAAATPGLPGATSTVFDVTAAAPSRLAFSVPPTNAMAETAITPAVAVVIQDAFGNTATASTSSVTLAIGTNPGSGTLSGATTAGPINGVATFPNLSINKAGAGYTLAAASTGLPGATSSAFNVTAGIIYTQTPVNVSNNPTSSGAPSFARGGGGSINVVWEERRTDIVFSRSVDGGRTFAPPRYVVAPGDYLGSENDFWSGQMNLVSTTDSALHVIWTIFDALYGGAEIFYSRSGDGGTTFSAPLLLSVDDGMNSYGSSVATDGTRVGVAWSDADLNTGTTSVWYRVSVNSGATFSVPTYVGRGIGPSVALVGQSVYVAWVEEYYGQTQTLFARSADGGATFTAPRVIAPYASNSGFAALHADPAGTIYMARGEKPGLNTVLLFSRSADEGVSFSAPTTLTLNGGCPSFASGDGGRVLLTWAGGIVSFLAVSLDRGVTLSAPIEIPGRSPGASCVQVTAGPSAEAGFAWFATPAGQPYADIYHAVGRVVGF